MLGESTYRTRIFRDLDGMYCYLKDNSKWGRSNRSIERTNDAVEAVTGNIANHLLVKELRNTEGDWVDVVVHTTINVED